MLEYGIFKASSPLNSQSYLGVFSSFTRHKSFTLDSDYWCFVAHQVMADFLEAKLSVLL